MLTVVSEVVDQIVCNVAITTTKDAIHQYKINLGDSIATAEAPSDGIDYDQMDKAIYVICNSRNISLVYPSN
jgi:hypothetical protein